MSTGRQPAGRDSLKNGVMSTQAAAQCLRNRALNGLHRRLAVPAEPPPVYRPLASATTPFVQNKYSMSP
jgi:hypothetical protein